MAAFAELGLCPELITEVERQGWLLPTPVQAEAVPLILGGGDVMAAAETGSGKTGAFALPVLQIVHETVRARENGFAKSRALPSATKDCVLNINDRDAVVAVSPDGLRCQARSEASWGGVRSLVGAHKGRIYYEATVADEGLCRVGWSQRSCSLDLGTEASFGYGGTGKRSTRRQFEDYGGPYGLNDVIGCLLDHEHGSIAFTGNGQALGEAFRLGPDFRGVALFPAVSLKNAELSLNFGAKPFAFPPPQGFLGLAQAPSEWLVTGERLAVEAHSDKGPRKPTAVILEPSKELAEQTAEVISQLQGSLTNPQVQSTLLLGGEPIKKQERILAQGCDIVTGTPGRMMDLIKSGKLATDAVKFFVLDEADRLLDTGNQDTILQMFQRFPKATSGTARLQVLMFSATLHSEEVRSIADRICQNPILVDLKGKEAVPEAVDHVLLRIDPREDRSWLQSEPSVLTDNAHAFDATGPQLRKRENWSQAVKILKPRMLHRIIDHLKIDQCLIFCRTNYDCDNLEAFLTGLGGGRRFRGKMEKGLENPYSCLVLAGARSVQERKQALQAFKDGDVRFLICTDVAARGLDIHGLPYVVNMTLPDRAEDYIHRVGRVGRADRLGLAISLVAQVEEKVWFCRQKGHKPWLKPSRKDVLTHEEGGHTMWYNEPALLEEIEQRLKQPVVAVCEDLSLPPHIQARLASSTGGGQATYGQDRSGTSNQETLKHQEALRPAVALLADLERQAQLTFFDLKRFVSTATPT